MTVKELKEVLSKYPDDMGIVISRYEYGVDDLDDIEEVQIFRNVWSGDYGGSHEIVDETDDYDYHDEDHKNQPRYSVLYFPR